MIKYDLSRKINSSRHSVYEKIILKWDYDKKYTRPKYVIRNYIFLESLIFRTFRILTSFPHVHIHTYYTLYCVYICVFFNTIVRTRHVLDSAKIPLHPDAYTVILIWQLQSGRRIVIEGFYLARDSGEILKTAFLSSIYRAASYLRDTNLPRSRKRIAACNEGQSNRVGLPDARVYVH